MCVRVCVCLLYLFLNAMCVVALQCTYAHKNNITISSQWHHFVEMRFLNKSTGCKFSLYILLGFFSLYSVESRFYFIFLCKFALILLKIQCFVVKLINCAYFISVFFFYIYFSFVCIVWDGFFCVWLTHQNKCSLLCLHINSQKNIVV